MVEQHRGAFGTGAAAARSSQLIGYLGTSQQASFGTSQAFSADKVRMGLAGEAFPIP